MVARSLTWDARSAQLTRHQHSHSRQLLASCRHPCQDLEHQHHRLFKHSWQAGDRLHTLAAQVGLLGQKNHILGVSRRPIWLQYINNIGEAMAGLLWLAGQRQRGGPGVSLEPGASWTGWRSDLNILQHSLGKCLFARQCQWRGVDRLPLPPGVS